LNDSQEADHEKLVSNPTGDYLLEWNIGPSSIETAHLEISPRLRSLEPKTSLKKQHRCTYRDCGRLFERADNLLDHQRRRSHFEAFSALDEKIVSEDGLSTASVKADEVLRSFLAPPQQDQSDVMATNKFDSTYSNVDQLNSPTQPNLDEEISDLAERRRNQNRIGQRNYREYSICLFKIVD
jgi:hypothetical protein